MAFAASAVLTPFASEVLEGLTRPGQKKLSPAWLYDDLGSCLFEAITLLPEYGLTRADERLLRRLSPEIGQQVAAGTLVVELGSGSGKKTRSLLDAIQAEHGEVRYSPIDVSRAALDSCCQSLSDVAMVDPLCETWMDGLDLLAQRRLPNQPVLLLFLGSSIGNIDRDEVIGFLTSIRRKLRPGDLFLVGADLVKPIDTLIAAYDDPAGITAAFNRNLLARINRELEADFDLRQFAHEARWDANCKRIEMHLVSRRRQTVHLAGLQTRITFAEGESIWTESSHKFTEQELAYAAPATGFETVASWLDRDWPFTEVLWRSV